MADHNSQINILPPGLVDSADRERCARSLAVVRRFIPDRSLVFFIGAGVSHATPTMFPVASQLLHVLFEQILARLEGSRPGGPSPAALREHSELCRDISRALKPMAGCAGLEITLSELRQTWAPGFRRFLERCAELASVRPFNASHLALATWLKAHGTVITTNYDCFIEEAYSCLVGQCLEVRYWTLETPAPHNVKIAFDTWREDLDRGGVLFKLHGSFQDLETCLTALDQVQTALTGDRADLIEHVMSTRPVCFVGWQGIDPDIPPVIAAARNRNMAEPLIWTFYEGPDPASPFRLQDRLNETSPTLSHLSMQNPLVTEANRLFEGVLGTKALAQQPRRIQKRYPVSPGETLRELAADMPPASAARFLGIVARRAGRLGLATRLESAATHLAEDRSQWAAAVQEGAHVSWQEGQRQRAARDVARASAELRYTDDISMRLTADFGALSMAVVNLRSEPTVALRLRSLCRQYRSDIELLEEAGGEPREIHLHKALYHLYRGRLRGFLTMFAGSFLSRLMESYVLSEFDAANHHIEQTGDIHPHARVDVLSYRALALARFHRCVHAWHDLTEAERLSLTLRDDARAEHLQKQKLRLAELCGPKPPP